MGLLSKPPRCQIPAERLTIAFPTLRKVRKEKGKYQSPGLAVCSQINGKRSLPLHPLHKAHQFRKYDREGRAVINSSPTDIPPPGGWGLLGLWRGPSFPVVELNSSIHVCLGPSS